MSRRDARRHAFVLIFQFPFHQPYTAETLEEAYALYTEGLPEEEQPDTRDEQYIRRVTSGAFSKLAELDTLIEGYLKDWRLERINRVDLAILRLSAYELLFEPEIPAGAAVNEAVELAKQYGADESPAFVNGVLGGVYRTNADV